MLGGFMQTRRLDRFVCYPSQIIIADPTLSAHARRQACPFPSNLPPQTHLDMTVRETTCLNDRKSWKLKDGIDLLDVSPGATTAGSIRRRMRIFGLLFWQSPSSLTPHFGSGLVLPDGEAPQYRGNDCTPSGMAAPRLPYLFPSTNILL